MTGRRPGFAAKAGLTLAALLYAAAALGSGLDRLAANAPSLGRFVPSLLRAEVNRTAAAAALGRGDRQNALAAADRAVRAEPIHPVSAALLGAARQLAGDAGGAEAAFRVAGQLGWRSRLTQLYWYDAAIRSEDYKQAALRVDALLRSDPAFAGGPSLLEPLEASDGGRLALAGRLAGRPVWLRRYFEADAGPPGVQLQRRAEVALAIAAGGTQLGCKIPGILTGRLLARGNAALAKDVWQAHCSIAPPQQDALADERFEVLADLGDEYPFGWRRHLSGDVSASVTAGGDGTGHRLSAANSGRVSRLLLTQSVELSPGRYRLFADLPDGGEGARGAVAASLDCGQGTRLAGLPVGDASADGQLLEAKPCSPQTLGLWLRPAATDVVIGRVWIVRSD